MSTDHNTSYSSENGSSKPSANGHHNQAVPKRKPGNSNRNTDDDEIDLKQLAGTLFRYKWWVAGFTIICLAASLFIASMITPIYQSSGTILITDDRNRFSSSGTDLSNVLSTSFGVGTGSRLVNEIEVLQSRSTAAEIASRIMEQERMENGEVFPILWRDFPEDSTIITSAELESRVHRRLEVERSNRDADIIRITYESPSPLEAKTLVDITMESYTDISARQNRTAANSALDFLQRERDNIRQQLEQSEIALRDYQSNTNLIQVDGQTQAVIERLTELETQRQQLRVQRVALNSSIESYESQLDQIRPGLAERLSDNVSGRIQRAQLQLAELRTEQSLMLQRNPGLRNNPEAEPRYMGVLEDIETLRSEIQEMSNSLINADDSDVFIGFLEQEDGGVTSRILDLRRQLIELRIQESQLDAQEQVISERMAEENEFFDGLPDNILELARLRREVQIQEEVFKTISSQYAETQLWEQTQFGAGRPIDFGTYPTQPVRPVKLLFALVGLVLGGIFSVGFVVTRETFHNQIDGAEKLKETGYPLLAVIPDFSKHVKENYKGSEFANVKGKRVSTSWETLLNPISPIAESYRRLHNNVVFSNPDKKCQVIVVTSSKKSEGKSTISLNLAVSLAESGKKVILIDADLRRPNLHTLSGEERTPGLTGLFYKDLALEEAVVQTLAPAVHLITSGKEVANPAAVTQSRKLRNLVEALRKEYDHIIIDTPPYGIITDAAPLMQYADGVIVASRFNDTRSFELEQTLENLEQINADILGTVLTAYKHQKSREYYYYNYKYNTYKQYEEYKSA